MCSTYQLHFLFCFSVTDGEINVTISEEKRLVRYLMRRYKLAGRGGRPVLNYTEPVKVAFGLGLIQMELNEKLKMLITSMWSRFVRVMFCLNSTRLICYCDHCWICHLDLPMLAELKINVSRQFNLKIFKCELSKAILQVLSTYPVRATREHLKGPPLKLHLLLCRMNVEHLHKLLTYVNFVCLSWPRQTW